MSGMEDLVTWFRAQLDDDERVARECEEDASPWRSEVRQDASGYTEGRIRTADGYTVVHVEDQTPGITTARHIARWDPARVLAEVDAKRRILDAHFPVDPCDAHDAMSETIACDTLRLLALPFADKQGYREEWRPDGS